MGNVQEYCGGNCINAESNLKFSEKSFTERNKTLNDYQEILIIKALNAWKRYHREKNYAYSTKNLTQKLKKLDELIEEKKGKFIKLKAFEGQIPSEINDLVLKIAKKEHNLGFKSLDENKLKQITEKFREELNRDIDKDNNEKENPNFLILRKPVLLENEDIYFGNWNLQGNIEGYGKLLKKIKSKDSNNNENIKHLLIEGFFKEDKCIYGRLFYPNGIYYEGKMENNLPNTKNNSPYYGELKIFEENSNTSLIIYNGEWLNGKYNGKGLQILGKNNEFKYEGNFQENLFCDYGKLFFNNPKEFSYLYEGNFDKNKFEGEGNFKYFNYKKFDIDENTENSNLFVSSITKEEYNGYWRNGLPDGKGVYIWNNGNIYEGNYGEGKKKGIGKFTFNKGNSSFEGIWSNGKPNGKGVLIITDKDKNKKENKEILEEEREINKIEEITEINELKISGVWKQGQIQKIDNIEDFEKTKKSQEILNIPIENEIFSNYFHLNIRQITTNKENITEIFNDENNGKIQSSKYMNILSKGIEKNIVKDLDNMFDKHVTSIKGTN